MVGVWRTCVRWMRFGRWEATLVSADDVAASIIAAGPVDQMQLHKLLYLVQAAHLSWFEEPAFGEQIEAWTYGPVVRGVVGHYKDWNLRPITEPYRGDPTRLSERTAWVVEYVRNKFGNLAGPDLAALVKGPGSPWRQIRGPLPEDASSSMEIPPSVIREFHTVHGLGVPQPTPNEQALAQRFFDGDHEALDDLFESITGVRPYL